MKKVVLLIVVVAIGAAAYLHFGPKKKSRRVQKAKVQFELNNNAIVFDKKNNQITGAIVNFEDGQHILTNQLLLQEICSETNEFVTGNGAQVVIDTSSIELAKAYDLARVKFSCTSPDYNKDKVFNLFDAQKSSVVNYYIYGNNLQTNELEQTVGSGTLESTTFMPLGKNNIRSTGSLILTRKGQLIGIGTSSTPSAYSLGAYNRTLDDRTSQKLASNSQYKDFAAIANKEIAWASQDSSKYLGELEQFEDWSVLIALCKELYQRDEDSIDAFSKNSFIKYLFTRLNSSSSKKSFFKKIYKNYSKLVKYTPESLDLLSANEVKEARKNMVTAVKNQNAALTNLQKGLNDFKPKSQYFQQQIKSINKLMLSVKNDNMSLTNKLKQVKQSPENSIEDDIVDPKRTKETVVSRSKQKGKAYLQQRIDLVNSDIKYYQSKYTKAVATRDRLQRKKLKKTPSSSMNFCTDKIKKLKAQRSRLITELKSLGS